MVAATFPGGERNAEMPDQAPEGQEVATDLL